MVKISVHSFDRKTSVEVDVENVSSADYEQIVNRLSLGLKGYKAYAAIADAFVFAIKLCPSANPSDIWQHIIYRKYIESGRNEQSWKRASGDGFERALELLYNPVLQEHGIRLVKLSKSTAAEALSEMGLTGAIAPSKIDIAIEGRCSKDTEIWKIFGVIHSKTSLAERIVDDAPASKVVMNAGFLSIAATLDSKSFPPPHGNGINYGELGGRTSGSGEIKAGQQKREYIEEHGDFSSCYSFNLRTPNSPVKTKSGSRIIALPFLGVQPDEFVRDLLGFWNSNKDAICEKMPITKVG